jgi:hypothetical protein
MQCGLTVFSTHHEEVGYGIILFVKQRTCIVLQAMFNVMNINPLMPNGHYSDRTAPLSSRCCILNIYSTNIHTEYFKHAA